MSARKCLARAGIGVAMPAMLAGLLFGLLQTEGGASGAPSISNIHVSQREGTKLVDVYYDLSGATPPVTVSVQVSTNSGASYDLTASSFTGDVGAGGTNGTGLHIVWDAGADWDGHYSPTVRFRVSASDSPPPVFVLIPAGNFQMGDSFLEGYPGETPVHTVYVSAFYMQATEVSKAQWDEVRSWGLAHGYTDLSTGAAKASNHPVQTVSWYAVVKWCNARSEKEGRAPCYTVSGATYRTGSSAPGCNFSANGYRLPTEAEWEKAARGGAVGRRFPWSDANTVTHSRANYFSNWIGGAPYYPYDVNPYPGYHTDFDEGGDPYTSPVGYFAANGYGLYDMAGNVSEWCWDWLDQGYYGSSPPPDPTGPTSGGGRVLRGGEWNDEVRHCRVAMRRSFGPGYSAYIGFRPVRR